MDLIYQQANDSLKAFSPADRDALVHNLVESLMFLDGQVQEKMVDCLKSVNLELGTAIQKQL
ncbi:hypothetical protein Ami103574_09165 [Aminipila butyrica]|uniref:Catalase immune-responsive domain-containing protein n=1 Tax=Aminipila butyrica TaxID=433296 RepID=A0A858BZH1_9FIRM|nr:catalase-related domain-containing protein [Aminipila butyrica]QIB69486.1 hypothetical protein Ami103574_09165 [Aminipila butyrica]